MTVTLNNSDLGGTGTNSWSLRTEDPGALDVANLNNLSELIETFYTDHSGTYSTDTSIRFDGLFNGLGDDEGQLVEGDTWTVDGVSGGESLPPANCIVVGWRTDSGGRNGRGRTFLGPVHINALDSNGTIEPSFLSTIRSTANDLVSASTAIGNGAVGVYSKQENVFRDFTSTATRDTFAVLRSRRD